MIMLFRAFGNFFQKLMFFGLFAFQGCASQPMPTPYQPLDSDGGFLETQISDNEYQLEVYANEVTKLETIEAYWHRRANELCKNHSYWHHYRSAYNNKTIESISGNTRRLTQRKLPYVMGQLRCL